MQARLSQSFERVGTRGLRRRAMVRRQEGRILIGKSGVEVSGTRPSEANLELTWVEVHLFCNQDRLRRADALTNISVLGNERYLVRADLDPGIEGD
ncbi:hypothetical protein ACVWZW_002676 [Bradyrhizobium sp. F1.13.4]